MFFKICVLKNFASFTKTTVVKSLFDKVARLRPATLLKRDSKVFSSEISNIFRSTYFYRAPPVAASISLYGIPNILDNDLLERKCRTACFELRMFKLDKTFQYRLLQVTGSDHYSKIVVPIPSKMIKIEFEKYVTLKALCFL